MNKSNKISAFALLAISLVAIFTPDIGPTSRFLTVEVQSDNQQRGLQASTPAPTPPPGMGFSCPLGQEAFSVDWKGVSVSSTLTTQTVTFANGMSVTMTIRNTGSARATKWGKDAAGYITFTVKTTCDASDIIIPNSASYPEYPDDYSTMELTFDRELEGLFISISDVDSGGNDADAVRIRFYDAAMASVPTTFSMTGFVREVDGYGFAPAKNLAAVNPGFAASLYARANGAIKTISLDQSLFCFKNTGLAAQRTIYPALDFAYCAPTMAPTPGPTETPTPGPTDAIDPVPAGVVIADALPSPVEIPTPLPTLPPTANSVFTAGVNGDPLIMGLSGQLFNFDGRSGAWFSAISSPSFQWNMKVQRYDSCPSHSDNFVSGVGLTFKKGWKKQRIEVNVVDSHNVDAGCGADTEVHCLGSGSLELIIDGVKHIVGGDYTFKDGTGRVVVFNTFHQCTYHHEWVLYSHMRPST